MYDNVIAEYEAEIAAVGRRMEALRAAGRLWEENARYKQLECMRSDLMCQLHEARAASSRGRPQKGGGSS